MVAKSRPSCTARQEGAEFGAYSPSITVTSPLSSMDTIPPADGVPSPANTPASVTAIAVTRSSGSPVLVDHCLQSLPSITHRQTPSLVVPTHNSPLWTDIQVAWSKDVVSVCHKSRTGSRATTPRGRLLR